MMNPVVFHEGGCERCNGDFVLIGAYSLLNNIPRVNGVAWSSVDTNVYLRSNGSPTILACLQPTCRWLHVLTQIRWSN